MRKAAIIAEELIANWELGTRNGGRPISVWALQGSEPWETYFSVDEVMLGTTWKQYELPVASSTTDTHAQFIFGLGQTTGTVFIDDVQLQTGSREVWRRDYSGGTVLVNATGMTKHIKLGATFRKIRGIQIPAINDGRQVNQVTLQPRDGIILRRTVGTNGNSGNIVPVFQILLHDDNG